MPFKGIWGLQNLEVPLREDVGKNRGLCRVWGSLGFSEIRGSVLGSLSV